MSLILNQFITRHQKSPDRIYDESTTTALSKLQVHQWPRINLLLPTAESLSDTWVLSIDGVCESSHSHTNRKLFIGSHRGAKVKQGPDVCDLCGEAPQCLMLVD